ncbi:MAG TPA: tetratricopeptide repeat protein, partial [Blastocatellia bacterium]|nr:tetratricopeptide repeat protein [Blastocatellia bacterium]
MIKTCLMRSVFLCLFFLAWGVTNAEGQHTLQGRVALPNNAPPANAVKVTLTFNGIRVHETFTDLSGRFSFSGLKRGTYQLTAEGDGQQFETTSVYAEVAAFANAPQVFTQNIQLRLKRGKQTPVAAVVSVDELESSIPDRARKEHDKGLKQARDNNPEKAIKHFQEAIHLYPQYYLAHIALGDQYAKLQRYDEAMDAYQKAVEMRSDRAEAHTGIGVTLVKQKRYADALAPLRRSIELDKRSSTAFLFLGLAEMMTSDYQSSETNLLRAYEIDRPTIAHIYLANLYDLRGEPEKAVKHLESFLKENPNSPNSR